MLAVEIVSAVVAHAETVLIRAKHPMLAMRRTHHAD
jgi:hypothetical protein